MSKGKFDEVDIARVIEQIHDADIDVMANYMVGLPGETHETMRETLDLALALGTSGWNMYTAMALPGSELYAQSVASGSPVPNDYLEYSFHSYETTPMSTDFLTPAEILQFRDNAFIEYHASEQFRGRIRERFGKEVLVNVEGMNKYRMRRRIVEEAAEAGE